MSDLGDQAVAAAYRMVDHANAAFRIDRIGWTRQQWIEDARRLMDDIDGSVSSLLNGHVMALLEAEEGVRALCDEAERKHVRLSPVAVRVTLDGDR